jgi:cellulose synthase/poly-beta-1,6-N-acetylglucosamine synthase-like glycosyltransferase
MNNTNFGISAHITKERRNPDSLTPWEVAGIRKLAANNEKQMQLHASGGTIWCLTGRTLLLRTAAVKPGQFLSDWTNERFWGQLIQTGEDSFLTRWLREKGWKVFHQDAPEAEVFTDVKKDANYIGQLIRWRRNGFQAFIMQLFVTPGFWTIFRENPYFARKLAEELARPFLAFVHFVGWVVCIWRTPIIAWVPPLTKEIYEKGALLISL